MNKSATFLALSMLFISASHAANEGWGSWLYNGATSGAAQFGTHFVSGFPAGCVSALAKKGLSKSAQFSPLSSENTQQAVQFVDGAIMIALAQKTECGARYVERAIGAPSKSNKTRWEQLAGLAGTSAGWFIGQNIANGLVKKAQS